jgi:hypothetical protein
MDPKFFRKYADLIVEAEQPDQLNEGMMDMLKPLAAKFVKMIGPEAMQDIAAQVKQVTGGDLTPSKENAMKVAQAFGLDQKPEAVAEGIAGNWEGKLRQLVYSSGLLGSVAGAVSMWGTPGAAFAGAVGMILLMGVAAFFGDAPGQVGAMGKFGNKGTSTQKGLDITGRLTTNRNVD